MNRFRLFPAGLLVAGMATLSTSSAHAQFAGMASLDRSIGRSERIDWLGAQFIVAPDSREGVHTWMSLGQRQAIGNFIQQGIELDFDPAALKEWLADARFVANPEAAHPASHAPTTTGELTSVTGGSLRLTSLGQGVDGLDYALQVTTATGETRVVGADAQQVGLLLDRLNAAASHSRLVTAAGTAGCVRALERPGTCAPPILQSTTATWALYQAGNSRGDVWAQYVVDESGRVRPGSIDILYASNEALVRAAKQLFVQQRFTPATNAAGLPTEATFVAHWSYPPMPHRYNAPHGNLGSH